MAWRADLKGAIELRRDAERMASDLSGPPMVQAMRLAASVVVAQAQQFAKVDSGRWRASMTPAVELHGTTVVGIAGSNLSYGPMAHEDVKPHWPPIGALTVWARRHGTTAFVVARGISRHGTKGDHAFTRAIDAKEGQILRILDAGVGAVLTRKG